MGVLAIEIRDAVGTQSKFWRIVDGEDVLARSETMHNKRDAVAAATHIKEDTPAYRFEVIRTQDPQYPFSWHASRSGRIVVASTNMYTLYGGADVAKEYVRLNIHLAPIVDLTTAPSNVR